MFRNQTFGYTNAKIEKKLVRNLFSLNLRKETYSRELIWILKRGVLNL